MNDPTSFGKEYRSSSSSSYPVYPAHRKLDQGLRKEEKCIPLIENYDQGPRKEKMRQAIPIKEV